jgi:biopolymer transport protein TolR
MAGSEERADGLITHINVTPLVDVVLVLLIIFMATAPLIQRRAIGVNVPKAATGEKATAALQVFFNADQQILLEKTPQTLESLTRALKERKLLEPDLRVSLSAEGALPYNRVVEVLDAVRSAGVAKVALEVNPRPTPKR